MDPLPCRINFFNHFSKKHSKNRSQLLIKSKNRLTLLNQAVFRSFFGKTYQKHLLQHYPLGNSFGAGLQLQQVHAFWQVLYL